MKAFDQFAMSVLLGALSFVFGLLQRRTAPTAVPRVPSRVDDAPGIESGAELYGDFTTSRYPFEVVTRRAEPL